jgi:tRNA threonylcarbamoyladenosine biosynthesis protein TsaE
VRELREELGIECRIEDVFAVGHHVYPADAHTGGAPKEVFLLVYQAVHIAGTPQALEVADFAWIPGEAVANLPLPPADVPVVDRLRRALAETVFASSLPDEDATRAVGEAFGRHLQAGDVVCAQGDLGAGKTCFAQGVARGLEVPAGHYVNSPTFAIAQVHPGRVPFCHLDLYRVSDADEAEGLGLDELVGTDGVAYVEWPSRIPELIPADHLCVRLAITAAGRALQITAHGPRSAARLGAFIHARSF